MTLPDRAADLSRYFLEQRSHRMRLRLPDQQAPYIYRSLVCAGNLKLGLFSFASLAACARRWPRIQLCVDESISAPEVTSFYERHGIMVEMLTPEDLDNRMEANGETVLRRFAKTFFWGRKTAFTFGLREEIPILYCDLDVLWFQDPWEGLGLAAVENLLASEDICFSYNKEFLAMISPAHRDLVVANPPYCAGLYAVAPGYTLPHAVLDYLHVKLESMPPGYFYEAACAIEQTCLGLATKLSGRGIPFNRLPTCPERSAVYPAYHHKHWLAAHYAGPTRRQFWRDAWSLLR